MKLTLNDKEITNLIDKIIRKVKYKNVNIPFETVESIILDSLDKCKKKKDLEQLVEEKIHNIVALYLGDLDYTNIKEQLSDMHKASNSNYKEFSKKLLSMHASTSERLEYIEAFYDIIFSKYKGIQSIADLACGLHPFGIPFMNLAPNTKYYAYDLNFSRVMTIDYYIKSLGYQGGGYHKDILISPPKEEFDVIFFFKEAHRFEKRKKGCLNDFLKNLNSSNVIISLPLRNLGGNIDLSNRHDRLIDEALHNTSWEMECTDIFNERLYFITK